ncbi:MAG: helix-turn-helix domain-containing protein [Clostridiales Family XIII bacterium]|nr:helix-turn-helix domain-containing protein [Clostridiales Family XIII bacterium]
MLELKLVSEAGPFFHRDALELLFLLDGEAEVISYDDTASLKAGDFAIIDAGISHEIKCARPSRVVSMYFDLNHYEKEIPHVRGISFEMSRGRNEPERAVVSKAIRDYMIRLLIVRYHEMPEWREIFTELGRIMMPLLCYYFQNMRYLRRPLSKLREADVERLHTLVGFVAKNYRKRDVSIKDIAAAANLSASRTAHFWKEMISISLHDAVLLTKILEASRILLESDLPINEISDRCGFSDEKYLYSHFKKSFGMTPNEFRQMHYVRHKSAGGFKFLKICEERAAIREYGYSFYATPPDFAFLTLDDEWRRTEENLFRLYGYVLNRRDADLAQIVRRQGAGYISVEPAKALVKRGGEYHINWEYVYGAMFWYNELSLNINISLRYSLMPRARWRDILDALWFEMLRRWGPSLADRIGWIIMEDNLDCLAEAAAAADSLCVGMNARNVTSMFVP